MIVNITRALLITAMNDSYRQDNVIGPLSNFYDR